MRVKVVVFAGVCWLCATLALGQNSAVNQGISNITGTGARALAEEMSCVDIVNTPSPPGDTVWITAKAFNEKRCTRLFSVPVLLSICAPLLVKEAKDVPLIHRL